MIDAQRLPTRPRSAFFSCFFFQYTWVHGAFVLGKRGIIYIGLIFVLTVALFDLLFTFSRAGEALSKDAIFYDAVKSIDYTLMCNVI